MGDAGLVGSLFLKGLRALRAPTPTASVLGACAKADQSHYRWLTSDHVLVVPSQVNLDLTISVLSFLLSDNALFLRDALIDELLDTMDEVRFGCCRALDAVFVLRSLRAFPGRKRPGVRSEGVPWVTGGGGLERIACRT